MSSFKWISPVIDIQKILRDGQLTVTGRLIDASNATLLADCTSDDNTLQCIYKPVAGERPLWDFPDGNLAQREYAAYLISEYSQLNLVPVTLLREGPFGFGMVQEWINIDESVDLATYFSTDDSQLRKMALFDAVINNTDRKIGHLLPRADGKLFGCDHGVTFHAENKLRTVLWQWAGMTFTEEEIGILQLIKSKIENKELDILQSLISDIEYQALLERVDNLLSSGSFPLPHSDWPSIPWPAF